RDGGIDNAELRVVASHRSFLITSAVQLLAAHTCAAKSLQFCNAQRRHTISLLRDNDFSGPGREKWFCRSASTSNHEATGPSDGERLYSGVLCSAHIESLRCYA